MKDVNPLPNLDATEGSELHKQCFGSAEEVMNRYSRCQLCGSNLHFSHITDFSKNITQEIAKCPECGIRVRRVLHKLQ